MINITNITIEPPIKIAKNRTINRLETDEFKPVTCKIVDVKDGLFRTKRKMICVGIDKKDIEIFDLD